MKKIMPKIFSLILCLVLASLTVFGSVIITSADGETEKNPAPKAQTQNLEELVMDKYATDNGDGTFKLTIETYTTGEVVYTPVEKEMPADMVLVFDHSSSMRNNYLGSKTRYAALKDAICDFIDTVSGTKDNPRYTAECDHRIALVAFGNTASVVAGWTDVDPAKGAISLKKTISDYSERESDTNPAAGFEKAADLLNQEYKGANPDRRKIVIMFTDGAPADSGDSFTMSFANNALVKAQALKDMGALIFTIGIFEDADPDCYYGSKAFYDKVGLNTRNTVVNGGGNKCDIYEYSTNGAVGTRWLTRNAKDYWDEPLYNRYMNFASSNFEGATNLSVTKVRESRSVYNYTGYRIDKTYPMVSDKYYLTATDDVELSGVFKNISSWIKTGGTSISLDKRAVVKDIVSDYFTLADPNDITKIETYVAECNGKDENGFTFKAPVLTANAGEEFSTVAVKVEDYEEESDKRKVSVTGFDFTKNFVAYDETNHKACGYKLIITFDIRPVEGFTGGNNVPTNNPESGIYPTEDSEALETYPQPDVNIPLVAPIYDVNFNNFVIYKGNIVCLDPIFTIGELDVVKDAFINRTIKYKYNGADFVELPNGLIELEKTTEFPAFSVSVTFTPKYDPDGDVGTEATEITVYNSLPFTVYVLEPTLNVSVNDLKLFYGTEHTIGADAAINPQMSITWKDPLNPSLTVSDISEGFLPAITVDELKLDYTANGYNGKITKKDLNVKIKAKYSETSDTVNIPTVYTANCAYEENCTRSGSTGNYIVHSQTGTLKINNVGGTADETFVYYIYKDGSLYTKVSVKGNSSVTLSELPTGAYNVVPDEKWAWRYSNQVSGDTLPVTLNADKASAEVTFTNTKNATSWINFVTPAKVNTYTE